MYLHKPPSVKINSHGVIDSVEFVVLHYTVEDLESTFKIFSDFRVGVSAHLVIDEDGSIYDLLNCLNEAPRFARHAGQSEYTDKSGKQWNDFNKMSIGIEMVNRNGNIIPYTQAQYDSLFEIVSVLRTKYVSLNDPERIVGHEHIAGWRGKVDPGCLFDWEFLYKRLYPGYDIPSRSSYCPQPVRDVLTNFLNCVPSEKATANVYWRNINLLLETYIRLLNEVQS